MFQFKFWKGSSRETTTLALSLSLSLSPPPYYCAVLTICANLSESSLVSRKRRSKRSASKTAGKASEGKGSLSGRKAPFASAFCRPIFEWVCKAEPAASRGRGGHEHDMVLGTPSIDTAR